MNMAHRRDAGFRFSKSWRTVRSGSGIREASRATLVVFAISGCTIRMNIYDCAANFKRYFWPLPDFKKGSRRGAEVAECRATGYRVVAGCRSVLVTAVELVTVVVVWAGAVVVGVVDVGADVVFGVVVLRLGVVRAATVRVLALE